MPIIIDNTFFDAHYNIGVYYFNLGVETLTNANQISDIKKYDNQIEKAKLYFSKAVPFFENCYRIKSNDPQISESIEASLKSIYNRLKQDNKFEIRNNALLNGTLLNQIGLKIEIPGIENTKTVVYNAEDKEGPTITLLSPVNSRGFKEVVSENTVIVKGKISDKNSVLIATLNGAELSLGSDGSFEQKVMLTNGLNTINIQALDKFKNSSDYQFTVEQKKTNTIVSTGNNPQKQALVIGNGNYKNSPLKNASNDARIMAKTLKDLGFNVTLLVDATNVQIKSAVSKFGAELEKDKNSVGLFYYAGHGIQVNGKNFLVPIDAQIEREPDVPVYSFDLDGLLTNIEYSGNSMNIIILDACRNNPFARSFRSLNSNGLAQLNAPTGTIIAFATAPGSTASDGSGENGLYTQELVKAIQVPNIPIETAFKKVRTQVKNLSNGLQIPWENSSLEGDFYFKK